MHEKGQRIRHSGVGGHHHNGVAENATNNLVRISRIMMIHAALRWTYAIEKILWTMAMDNVVNLHNHTTHIPSGIFTEEV